MIQLYKSLSSHIFLSYLLILLCAPAEGFGAQLPCEVLKSRIENNLQAKGVQSFTLTIVPLNADTTGKRVGTCDGGTHKIIYSRHNKGLASVRSTGSDSVVNQLRANIDFSFKDEGAPCTDCNTTTRIACCGICTPPANGLLARKQIAAQAAIAAKNGGCPGAIGLLLETQCHNPQAAALLASHAEEVCRLLRQH